MITPLSEMTSALSDMRARAAPRLVMVMSTLMGRPKKQAPSGSVELDVVHPQVGLNRHDPGFPSSPP